MGEYAVLPGHVGGKEAYVSEITSLFDDSCTKYAEPFVGAGGIFFLMPNGRYEKEWINDKNPNLANLYDVLAKKETREDAIKVLLAVDKNSDKEIAVQEFKEQKDKMIGGTRSIEAIRNMSVDERLEIVKATFWAYTQSFNYGSKGYSHRNINPSNYKQRMEKNLFNGMDRLYENLRITSLDGIKILEYVRKRPNIQVMADPPYVGLYRSSSSLYVEEMASLGDHIKMAEALKNTQAAVVLCGYRSPIEAVPTIYDAILGDEWKCFKIADTYKHSARCEKGAKKQVAHEYVWTNRVPERAKYYISMENYKEKLNIDEYWDRIRQLCNEWIIPPEHFKEYQEVYYETHEKAKLLTDELMSEASHRIKENRKKKRK